MSANSASARSSSLNTFSRSVESRARRASVCSMCGVSFVRRWDAAGRYCSRPCAFKAQKAIAAERTFLGALARLASGREMHRCDICGAPRPGARGKRCSEECRKEFARRVARRSYLKQRRAHEERRCADCGELFMPSHGSAIYCSLRCSRRAWRTKIGQSHRRRARHYGVPYEPVSAEKVFARDGWRCRLCGKATRRDKRGTWHPLAPELDHIVPLSKGGGHVYANVQCAHRQCNNEKKDTAKGQLLLIPAPLVA